MAKVAAMPSWFRGGFYGGLSLALLIGLFFLWLWQPERQINRHTQNLFHSIEHKNWAALGEFVGSNYRDQWGNDRTLLIRRSREVFRYVRGVRINTSNEGVRIEGRSAYWSGKITISGEQGEVMAAIKESVNSLTTPFELEWRRLSAKPWDWKLVRVANAELQIPEDAD